MYGLRYKMKCFLLQRKINSPYGEAVTLQLKQQQVRELSELYSSLCPRHTPTPCNYFIIFNL